MEEKERYELIGYCSYRDTETGVIGDNFVELLNQQEKENQQLRQQLHDLPKKIVEEIITYCNLKEFNPEFVDKEHQECVVSYTELIDFLDTILKEYGGENESK